MKSLISLVLCFLSSTALAQQGITFEVEKLSKPEKRLLLKAHHDIYGDLLLSDAGLSRWDIDFDDGIVAKSEAPDSLVSFGAKSFFNGMYRAYADHRPFVLSPDMIWLLISQGFARHINADSERMRKHFVDFSGRMTLIAKADKSYDDPAISWEGIISQFTAQIERETGNELTGLLTCDFSTTTSTEKVSSEITIMEAMKPYFEFIVMRIICGIPEITLQGTTEDWQKIADKAQQLKKYELGWWITELEPILTEFVNASKGDIDTTFWMNMFKAHSQKKYGAPDIIDGWVVRFFPYDKDGKRNNLKKLEGGSNLPDEMVKVDVTFVDVSDGATTGIPLEMWAGFIGLEQNPENFALTPKIGWMIRKKGSENAGIKKKLEIDSQKDGLFEGISIRVKEVPPILLELQEIKQLSITFIDSIRIPEALANVNIGSLTLSGKITADETERIRQLFPETGLKVNGELINPKKVTPEEAERIKRLIRKQNPPPPTTGH